MKGISLMVLLLFQTTSAATQPGNRTANGTASPTPTPSPYHLGTVVAPPTPMYHPGTVVVSAGNRLKVHTTSQATSPVVEELNNGQAIALWCKEKGTPESGSQGTTDVWYLVDLKGYATAAYINTAFESVLQPCGAPTPAPPPTPASGGCQAAIAYAKSHLGSPYMGCAGGVYRQGVPAPGRTCKDGRTCGQSHVYCEDAGDIGFDCSGLMFAMWKAVGKTFPCGDSSSEIRNDCQSKCPHVSKSALIPCDMMAKNGHVVMYIGDNQVIESSPISPPVNGVYKGTQIARASNYISNADYLGVRCPI